MTATIDVSVPGEEAEESAETPTDDHTVPLLRPDDSSSAEPHSERSSNDQPPVPLGTSSPAVNPSSSDQGSLTNGVDKSTADPQNAEGLPVKYVPKRRVSVGTFSYPDLLAGILAYVLWLSASRLFC